MKTNYTFLLSLLLCISTSILSAQEEPTIYYSMDYMMVMPDMHEDYIACEQAWKKIHAHNKSAGKIESWALMRIFSPSGSSTDYNYVTRTRFKDRHQLAAYQDNPIMPENWESLLTDDEVALVNRTSALRTYVKSELLSSQERILADDISDVGVAVLNFFKMPKGVRRTEHMKMERDLWMPFHKQSVARGKIKGWVMLQRELPMGSDYDYDVVTVDLFKNMEQFWEPFDTDALTKLNPGMSMDDIMKKTIATGNRGRVEIRKRVDGLSD